MGRLTWDLVREWFSVLRFVAAALPVPPTLYDRLVDGLKPKVIRFWRTLLSVFNGRRAVREKLRALREKNLHIRRTDQANWETLLTVFEFHA